jgi:hypothetical protein
MTSVLVPGHRDASAQAASLRFGEGVAHHRRDPGNATRHSGHDVHEGNQAPPPGIVRESLHAACHSVIMRIALTFLDRTAAGTGIFASVFGGNVPVRSRSDALVVDTERLRNRERDSSASQHTCTHACGFTSARAPRGR